MELLDHQVTIRVQGVRAALQEIAIRHLIEMVKEIVDKDEIVLLVSQVVYQRIPGTMYDRITIPSCARIVAGSPTSFGRSNTTDCNPGRRRQSMTEL